MAKKQRHECLKKLRAICGLTQQQLATKIGVSKAAITAIEVGQLPMSEQMARRIMMATGVDSHSLRDPTGEPTRSSHPFTGESYRANSDNMLATFHPADVVRASRLLGLLFRSASSRRRLKVVRDLFDVWVSEMILEFDLIEAVVEAGIESEIEMDEFVTVSNAAIRLAPDERERSKLNARWEQALQRHAKEYPHYTRLLNEREASPPDFLEDLDRLKFLLGACDDPANLSPEAIFFREQAKELVELVGQVTACFERGGADHPEKVAESIKQIAPLVGYQLLPPRQGEEPQPSKPRRKRTA